MSQSDYYQYPYYGYQQPNNRGAAQTQPAYGNQGFPAQQGMPMTQGMTQGQPAFPQYPSGTPPLGPQPPGMLPVEQSYIENILRLNKGKLATVYATFENNTEWNAKIFKGIIEAAGRDHVVISEPETGKRVLLPMVYLDYVTFDEEIEYEYPYGGGPALTQYSPR